MFEKIIYGDGTVRVKGLGAYSLKDTLECGQCFRHAELSPRAGESGESLEYMTVVGDTLLFIGQSEPGELTLRGIGEEDFERVARRYLALDRDLGEIKRDLLSRTDSEWLRRAADSGEGIAILAQDPWESLVSFIISQNNNIPRIKKIIRRICALYGVNLSLQKSESSHDVSPVGCGGENLDSATPCQVFCPISGCTVCSGDCAECGACYTFPTASDLLAHPELLRSCRVGFRYEYILAAARAVAEGGLDLGQLAALGDYEYALARLKEIRGVGDKVGSCVCLFGLGCLDAFPIDVWMRRAIDSYFDGSLDPKSLGAYAGIAQQYIFHYIRNCLPDA